MEKASKMRKTLQNKEKYKAKRVSVSFDSQV